MADETPPETESTGRTVAEAVASVLADWGAREEDVHLEVLDGGGRGWMGLGSRAARVRVRRLTKGEAAVRFLDRLGELTDGGFSVTAAAPLGDDESWSVQVEPAEPARWIGWHGQTLDALQSLCDAVATRVSGDRARLTVDVGGYRERRRRALEDMAKRAAGQARRLGREIALEPMSPAERRLVHLALRQVPGVRTESAGDGTQRHVVIFPEERAP